MALHLLVVEGNSASGREAYRAFLGMTAAQAYAATLRQLAPDAVCDICQPADSGANLPGPEGLAAYDGVFITGSALNLYDRGPEIDRQIDLARAIFASRTPFFGSCWGLQVATAATGGEVIRNPRGRELGIARNIWLTEAGRRHPLLAGRPPAYEAVCVHLDIVTPAPGTTVLAANAMAPIQAAEISFEGGRFWGVQYHPEFSLAEVGAIICRRASSLSREGFFAEASDAAALVADMRALDAEPSRADIAWRLGIGDDVLDPARRRTELINFIEAWVRPDKSARGRA